MIELALAEAEQVDDGPVSVLVSLQRRGTREVLDAACTLCVSTDPKRRELGARILGELGPPDPMARRRFPDECCDALIKLVRTERHIDVFVAAIFALGHLGNPRAEATLIAHARHRSPRVRFGIAFSLVGACWPLSENGTRALLALMQDRNVRARDWATTGIGAAVEFDTPQIREALLQRANDDKDEIVRAEAIHGLARRGDARGLPYLIAELSAGSGSLYLFDDAAKTYLGIDERQDVTIEVLITGLMARRQELEARL